MTDVGTGQRRSKGRDRVAALLFGAIAVVLLAMTVVYIRDQTRADPTQPPPTSPPGSAETIDVFNALREEGLETTFGRQNIPRGVLPEVGQMLVVDGTPLYAFIFPDVAAREEAEANADVGAILAAAPAPTTPTAAGEARLVSHSNVLVVFATDDEELAAAIERAMARIP